MHFYRIARLKLVGLIAVTALATTVHGLSSSTAQRSSTPNALPEINFSLTRLAEDPKHYSLVVSDTEEHVVSGTLSLGQLEVLRAVMSEAERFALGEEAVGSKEPITTRFRDKNEKAFIVDVEKIGNLSNLYLTYETESGRITAECGRVIRSARREDGFFFDLLSRLESSLNK